MTGFGIKLKYADFMLFPLLYMKENFLMGEISGKAVSTSSVEVIKK